MFVLNSRQYIDYFCVSNFSSHLLFCCSSASRAFTVLVYSSVNSLFSLVPYHLYRYFCLIKTSSEIYLRISCFSLQTTRITDCSKMLTFWMFKSQTVTDFGYPRLCVSWFLLSEPELLLNAYIPVTQITMSNVSLCCVAAGKLPYAGDKPVTATGAKSDQAIIYYQLESVVSFAESEQLLILDLLSVFQGNNGNLLSALCSLMS